ncbi:MAG TPA: NADAR family protein [Mycobacterium sp.]|nr:NADAR family protein [Mycobacterium sp.]
MSADNGSLASFDPATLDGVALASFDEGAPPISYRRPECVTFLKTAEQWGGFSNMAPGFPLSVNAIPIRTSEALYQACRFPHRPEVQREIIGETNPMVAKMKSRTHLRDSRPDFNSLRVPIMWWSLRVKLACNSGKFAPLLLATASQTIVEQSSRDRYWGAVPNEDVGILAGRNLLGRLLVLLRQTLEEYGGQALLMVPPLPIADFLLYGEPIRVLRPRLRSGHQELP